VGEPESGRDGAHAHPPRPLSQRQARQDAGDAATGLAADPANRLPPDLLRRYEVLLRPAGGAKPSPLRGIVAADLGALVSVRGVVTHVTDVKPLLTVATYLDDVSGIEVYQAVTGPTFAPLTALPAGAAARAGGGPAALHLQTRGSKFVKFQEVKLQELPLDVRAGGGGEGGGGGGLGRGTRHTADQSTPPPPQVPTGSTPRSMTVHLRGELTRSVKPGDAVTIAGAYLPVAATGPRGARSGLDAATFLEAMHVVQDKPGYGEAEDDAELAAAVDAAAAAADVYDRLASSLAPEIFGHEDVKKALLLAMVGGATRRLPDGMLLRGDVHVCLMGDPGVAKSQLLKHVAHLAPRAIYTTGRGSSGVGLTAAVQRDPVTGEMVLEGGALVLADRGICCIDEFDKMEEGDRTSIHEVGDGERGGEEGRGTGRGARASTRHHPPRHPSSPSPQVMEQQTVSIAKAGITTTLNTRTTLLAAANPAWGRYDPRRSPAENIALPAALLSRFDLMWLILDVHDHDADVALAHHVLTVHETRAAPARDAAGGAPPLAPPVLRAYIARAKSHAPVVPPELTEYVATVYAEMRAEEAAAEVPHSYTTARTLLSILRLAQALARLRFADVVGQAEIDEALRLMRMSKHSVLDSDRGDRARGARDPTEAAYAALRDDAQRTRRLVYGWDDLVALLGRQFSVRGVGRRGRGGWNRRARLPPARPPCPPSPPLAARRDSGIRGGVRRVRCEQGRGVGRRREARARGRAASDGARAPPPARPPSSPPSPPQASSPSSTRAPRSRRSSSRSPTWRRGERREGGRGAGGGGRGGRRAAGARAVCHPNGVDVPSMVPSGAGGGKVRLVPRNARAAAGARPAHSSASPAPPISPPHPRMAPPHRAAPPRAGAPPRAPAPSPAMADARSDLAALAAAESAWAPPPPGVHTAERTALVAWVLEVRGGGVGKAVMAGRRLGGTDPRPIIPPSDLPRPRLLHRDRVPGRGPGRRRRSGGGRPPLDPLRPPLGRPRVALSLPPRPRRPHRRRQAGRGRPAQRRVPRAGRGRGAAVARGSVCAGRSDERRAGPPGRPRLAHVRADASLLCGRRAGAGARRVGRHGVPCRRRRGRRGRRRGRRGRRRGRPLPHTLVLASLRRRIRGRHGGARCRGPRRARAGVGRARGRGRRGGRARGRPRRRPLRRLAARRRRGGSQGRVRGRRAGGVAGERSGRAGERHAEPGPRAVLGLGPLSGVEPGRTHAPILQLERTGARRLRTKKGEGRRSAAQGRQACRDRRARARRGRPPHNPPPRNPEPPHPHSPNVAPHPAHHPPHRPARGVLAGRPVDLHPWRGRRVRPLFPRPRPLRHPPICGPRPLGVARGGAGPLARVGRCRGARGAGDRVAAPARALLPAPTGAGRCGY